MATFNGARHLQEQLQSLAKQTRLPDELVVTDDCSSDNTMNILREFSEYAPFPVFITQNRENIGWGRNFSKALMDTSGDLVFLSDQDDVWMPGKLEYMVKLAEENPDYLLLMNDTMITDANLNATGYTKLGQLKAAGLSEDRFVMGSCSTVRRELIDLCLPVPKGFTEHDIWISHFANNLSGRLISDKVLQYYRRHDQNVTNTISSYTGKVHILHKIKLKLRKNSAALKDPGKQLRLIRKSENLKDGFQRALKKDTGKYAGPLEQKIIELENKIEKLKLRKEIRKNTFSRRSLLILKNYRAGFYSEFSGIKSALRDLFG